jgi:hypothetical protein
MRERFKGANGGARLRRRLKRVGQDGECKQYPGKARGMAFAAAPKTKGRGDQCADRCAAKNKLKRIGRRIHGGRLALFV